MFTVCCSLDNCVVVILATVVLLLITALVAAEVSLSVTFADFCYKTPDKALLLAADHAGLNGDPLDVIQFFLTCEGTNPLEPYIDDALTEMTDLNTTAYQVKSSSIICDDDAINDIIAGSKEVATSIVSIGSKISCSLINPIYTSVFYDIVCDDFVRGLFIMWSIQVSAAIVLYVSVCIYPYAAHPVRDDGSKDALVDGDDFILKDDDDIDEAQYVDNKMVTSLELEKVSSESATESA